MGAVRLARRSGVKKARVALAPKLAVVLLTMWRSQNAVRLDHHAGSGAELIIIITPLQPTAASAAEVPAPDFSAETGH
jgi:hypothetical protein